MKIRHYTPEQIEEIRTQLRETKNTRLKLKYQVIDLSMQGKQNKEIAGMFHLNETTVGLYINSYLQGGLTALVPQKKSRRPPFMTKEQSQALYDVIRDYVPHDVGFPGRYNWTGKLAAKWLKETYNIDYKESSILQQMHQIGLSHTRPSYVLANADKEKQAEFLEQLESEKKTRKWGD